MNTIPSTVDSRIGRPTGWPVPAALIGLSAIPLIAGALRLIQLAGGPEVIPADDRFAGFPAPLVVHILGAALYAVAGAFQFVPRLPCCAKRPVPTGVEPGRTQFSALTRFNAAG